MMIRKPKVLKAIAVFLTLNMLNYIFMPTVAYALTAGPTAPEYSSFEPIDTTDLVNLNTGDFTYNIPLITIPGPEGGYPLGLSYHGGIMPEEDASWVGLGWSLNVGAINRQVNGFADDYANAPHTVRDWWEGGKNHYVGASVPGPIPIDLAVSFDTYQGISVERGSIMGVSAGNETGGIGFNNSISFANVMTAKPVPGEEMAQNSSTPDFGSEPSLGVKMLSSAWGNWAGNVQASAYQSVNNNFGKIQTDKVVDVDLRLIKYKYQRYWMDAIDTEYLVGTLNGHLANVNVEGGGILNTEDITKTKSFDSYVLHDIAGSTSIIEEPNAEFLAGASFPAYDNYVVSGQGIGGVMQPLMLNNSTLFRKQKKNLEYDNGNKKFDVDYKIYKNSPTYLNKPVVNFRFRGDRSNTHQVNNPANFIINPDGAINYEYQSTPQWLGYTRDVGDGSGWQPYDYLTGSRHISHFTNLEISTGEAAFKGFKDTREPIDRNTKFGKDISKQIGGFSITNASGITYHYALPVYTYENGSYAEYDRRGKSTREINNDQPYAYTWLLTGVTGPDYVDRGETGFDEEDWGYWVAFEYGKHVDGYVYRSPFNGFAIDVEGSKTYAYGKKELYYLDAIRTRSFTGVFIKDFRTDAYGAATTTNGGIDLANPTLRLKEVSLFENSVLKTITNTTSVASAVDYLRGLGGVVGAGKITVFSINGLSNEQLTEWDRESLRTVVLNHDYSLSKGVPNNRTNDGKLTLKSIKFLGKGKADLLPMNNFYYDIPDDQKVQGTVRLPLLHLPTLIDNDVEGHEEWRNFKIYNQTGNVKSGDIIQFQHENLSYYATILKNNQTYLDIHLLGKTNDLRNLICETHLKTVNYQTTKNPPYTPHHRDVWRMFKSDYVRFVNDYNEDISKMPSEVSKHATDVWSLRRLETSLGSFMDITYESDDYQDIGVSNPLILNLHHEVGVVYDYDDSSQPSVEFRQQEHCSVGDRCVDMSGSTNVSITPKNKLRFYVRERNIGQLLEENFSVGDHIEIVSYVEHWENNGNGSASLINYDPIYGASEKGSYKIDEIGRDSATGEYYILVTDIGQHFIGFEEAGKKSGFFIHKGSFIVLPLTKKRAGGGVRVGSLSFKDGNGREIKTSYTYGRGTTSFEPLGYDGIFLDESGDSYDKPFTIWNEEKYKKNYTDFFKEQMIIARELPAPGVMYGSVEIKRVFNGKPAPTYDVYNFQTFNSDMVTVEVLNNQIVSSLLSKNHNTRTIKINDKTSQLGQLLKQETRRFTDDKVLTRIENKIITNASEFNGIGVLDELYHEHRQLKLEENPDETINQATVSIRSSHPTLALKTTSQNFVNHTSSSTEVLAYDFFTGQPTKSVTEDAFGVRIMTEKVPAYHKYPEMGPMKARTNIKAFENRVNNYHMLIQNAETYSYKVDTNNTPIGVFGASVQTWNNNWNYRSQTPNGFENISEDNHKVWRKHKGYVWKSIDMNEDGTLKGFDSYKWDNDTQKEEWSLGAEITLYNQYSTILESKDINGHYSAIKKDSNHKYTIADIANSKYNSFTYSGFEQELDGEIILSNSQITDSKSHTGQYSAELSANGKLYFKMNGSDIPENIMIGYWTTQRNDVDSEQLYYRLNEESVERSFNTQNQILNQKEVVLEDGQKWFWTQIILKAPFENLSNIQKIEVGLKNESNSSIFIDDFRLHPVEAPMSSYVYNTTTGQLDYVLNSNNLFTHFKYDEFGRLVSIWKETLQYGVKQLSDQKINYKKNH